MNKRQLKKQAKLETDFVGKKEYYHCPTCGWDALSDEEYEFSTTSNSTSTFNGDCTVRSWQVHVKCPLCKTKFCYEESDC